ncbi:MAG TPA: PHP domain-containing protein [Candidatus Thermoplasmatota archaeon]|nr:PHP domain-containing protein [Candidatus Thermoplasmatota archaeon]
MERLVDLHAHSTASDGSLTPRDLVRLAKHQGLSALALTDHDTLDGLEAAQDAAAAEGLELVPGVELAVDSPAGEVHLLGYLIDPQDAAFQRMLARVRDFRANRNPQIIAKLRALGLDITLEECAMEAGAGTPIGRPHMASVLLRKGYVSSIQEAFERFLADGAPAHVPKEKLPSAVAIRAIHDAGGVAVLAHPITIPETQRWQVLEAMAREGLDGVEVVYPKHDPAFRLELGRRALALGLVATGGSDFHGSRKPDTALGTGIDNNVSVPYTVLQSLKDRRATR